MSETRSNHASGQDDMQKELTHLRQQNELLAAERDEALKKVEIYKKAWKEVQDTLPSLTQKRRRHSSVQRVKHEQTSPSGPCELQTPHSNKATSSDQAQDPRASAKCDAHRDGIASKTTGEQPPSPPSVQAPSAKKLFSRGDLGLDMVTGSSRSALEGVQTDVKRSKPERSMNAVAERSRGKRRFAAKVERDPNRRRTYPALQPITVGEGLSNYRDPAALEFERNKGERSIDGQHRGYKFEAVVRDREKRKEMHGSDCFCCSAFYKSKRQALMRHYNDDAEKVDAEMRNYMQKATKHRTYHVPQDLQEDLRTIGIPGDTQFLFGTDET